MSGLSRPLCLALLLFVQCDTLEYEGFLSKPIDITLVQGVPTLPILYGSPTPVMAALDTGAACTVVQRQGNGERCTSTPLRLQDGRHPSVSRFIFRNPEVYDLTLGELGLDQPFAVNGLIGASLLRHFSVELIYQPRPQLTLSDEIPDTRPQLASACDPNQLLDPETADQARCEAVFYPSALGGGKVRFQGGDPIEVPKTRLMIPMCLAPAEFSVTKDTEHGAEQTSGVAVMALVSTGVGTSVLSRSAFERLRALDPGLELRSDAVLHLASGPQPAALTTLTRVALVSNESSNLGPCDELAFRRRLLIAGRVPLSGADRELREEDHIDGASVALVEAAISFAVVPDESPLIQGLRKELRSSVADVEVILGGSLLAYFDLILDYPAGRLIAHCADGLPAHTCQVLPWCTYEAGQAHSCPVHAPD